MNRIERETWEESGDQLAAARGIFVAFLLSLPIWLAVALLVFNLVRAGLHFDHWSWIVR